MARPTGTRVRRAGELVLTTLAGLAAYLLLISTVTWAEVLVGSVVALGVSVVGMVAIEPFRPQRPPSSVRWRELAWIPVDLVTGLAAFVDAVAHARGGADHRGHEERLALLEGEQAARVRAYGMLLLSATPGSYVLGTDEDAPGVVVRVHRLGPPSRADRAVTR